MVLPGEDELSGSTSSFCARCSSQNTCHHCRAEWTFREEMLRAAEEKQLAILSNVATGRLSGELSSYLDSRLAERLPVSMVF